jgi:hypothetical protein
MAVALVLAARSPALACSCEWKGAFLKVANDAPLIVHARVLRHHAGPVPAMDVLVIETLKGGLLDSGMRIQMDNGALCRPSIDRFPPGSEWILAVNGPGAKPGDGLAISACGEYWLRVEGDEVTGSPDAPSERTTRMRFAELRERLRHPAFRVDFRAVVRAGERFHRPFAGRLELLLEPVPDGWEIVVREVGRDENLARLTPPLHGLPNPREIEAWQFQDRLPPDCPRPYGDAPPPPRERDFVFSPEVGRGIDGPGAGRSVLPEEVEAVRRFGRGRLRIDAATVERGPAGCPRISTLTFEAQLEGGY